MDKVYIDNKKHVETVSLPNYGEIKLIVKEGKVVQYYTVESHVMSDK